MGCFQLLEPAKISMTTDNQTEYVAALTDLHRGLDRKGPGDSDFSLKILSNLSTLPLKPRIADLGCGSGASALLLAQYYQSPVMAVDSSSVFIDELKTRAKQLGLEHLIIPTHGDMAKLDWSVGSVDLLWSEGAAYNLGFEQALKPTFRTLVVEIKSCSSPCIVRLLAITKNYEVSHSSQRSPA